MVKLKMKLSSWMHLKKLINILRKQMLLNHESNQLKDDKIFARHEGNFLYVDAEKINYIDLSPKQLVSVSTALDSIS